MGHDEQTPGDGYDKGAYQRLNEKLKCCIDRDETYQAFQFAGMYLNIYGEARLPHFERAYSDYIDALRRWVEVADDTESDVDEMRKAETEYRTLLSNLDDGDESDNIDDESGERVTRRVPHTPEDVIIGTDVHSGEPVALPYERRDLGVTIIGRSGTGKSSLLEHLILADLKQGTPGVVIDPHGKLANRVITFAPSSAAHRIMLLEPSVTKPFGLNLLACRKAVDDEDDPVSWAADSVVETVKKLYGEQDKYSPRLEHYLDLAARTLIPNNRTLADAPRLFRNEIFRKDCVKRVTDRDVREDWKLYDSLRTTDQATHIEAVINRLRRMLGAKIIKRIVGSRQTTVPFEEVLEGDTMLIVSLPSERLTPERCNFIGAMVLCALADRVFARAVLRKS